VTLSLKRGKTTAKKCRERLQLFETRYAGRVSYAPTTEERVEEVIKRRDAMIPLSLRRDSKNANAAAGFFDGSSMFFGAFTQEAEHVAPEVRTFTPETASADVVADDGQPKTNWAFDARPSYQRPAGFRPMPVNDPPAPSYSAPTWSSRIAGAYDASTQWVSDRMTDAGQWVTDAKGAVKNAWFRGVQMTSGMGYKMIRAYRDSNWGTTPLVNGLKRIFAYMKGNNLAATDVAVGDLSGRAGGKLGGHKSHKRGRDVDIGFYMTDQAGSEVEARNFVDFASGRDGLSGRYEGKTVRFDAKRNWMLVKAILANPEPGFTPTNIFVATHLEKAMIAAAGDDPDAKRAAALMTYEPHHENHIHLRVE
jgi:hypothetical protein